MMTMTTQYCSHCLKEKVSAPMKIEGGLYVCRRCPHKEPLPTGIARELLEKEKKTIALRNAIEAVNSMNDYIDFLSQE